jgi:hypothetical protein
MVFNSLDHGCHVGNKYVLKNGGSTFTYYASEIDIKFQEIYLFTAIQPGMCVSQPSRKNAKSTALLEIAACLNLLKVTQF